MEKYNIFLIHEYLAQLIWMVSHSQRMISAIQMDPLTFLSHEPEVFDCILAVYMKCLWVAKYVLGFIGPTIFFG